MGNNELEARIKSLELELSILRSDKVNAVTEGEYLLKLAIEKAIPYSVAIFDNSGKQVYANQSFYDLFGWNQNETFGHTQPFLYWPASEIENIQLAFQQAFDNKAPKEGFELVFCHKSGRLIPVLVTFSQLTPNNNVAFWSANIIELSKSKNEQKNISKTTKQYQDIVETANDLIWECDNKGVFTYLNPAWEKALGYRRDEMLNKPFCHFQSREFTSRDLIGFQNLIKEKELSFYETVYKHKNGQDVYLSFNINFFYDEKDVVIGSVGTARDITTQKMAEKALIESEQKFKNLVQHSPNIIYTYSNIRGSLFWSESVRKILGYCPEEIQDNPFLWASSIHPDFKESVKKAIEDEEKGNDFSIEYRIKTKAGKWIWLHNTFTHKTKIGDEIIIEGYATDITARKEAEIALKENEAQMSALLNAIPDMMFVQNAEGVYIDFHAPNTEDLYALPEAFIGKRISDILPAEIALDFIEIFNKAIQTKQMQFYEYSMPIRNETKYFESRIIAYKENKVLSIVRDITANKHSVQALKESETKFKEIINQINDGITVFDEQGTIIVWNKGAEKITGIKAIDATNKNIVDVQYQMAPSVLKDQAQIANSIKNITSLQSPNVFNRIIDYEILIDSENIKNIQNVVFPIELNDFNLFCNVFRDITEVKQYEKQLIKLNSDKDRFMAILAHDLKSPFNGLIGLSGLLVKNIQKFDTDKIENVANVIHQTAIQTYNLLEELLLWTRAQSGKLPFNPQRLNFKNICNDIVDNLRLQAESKNIIINNLNSNELEILADMNMFKAILRNLVSNAIKFTNIGGTIDICTEKNHKNATITVSDNGIGIHPETLIKLFDISYIITTEGTANEKGTGLGLLLCKEFVEKHKGKIWVDSKYGESSKFKFTMPLYDQNLNNLNNFH